MRLAFLVTYFKPERGGLGIYVEEFCSCLKRLNPDLEIDIICCDTQKTKKYFGNDPSFNIYRLKSYLFLKGVYSVPSILGCFKLFQLLRKNKYDFIVTNTMHFLLSFWGALFAFIFRKKLIHIEHGSGFVPYRNPLVTLVNYTVDNIFGRFTMKVAKKVFSVSFDSKKFVESFGIKNVGILSNGINFDFFQSSPANLEKIKSSYNLSDEVIITSVSRVYFEKGIQEVIDALKDIQTINWKFLIVGDGDYKKALEEQVQKLNLVEKVIFVGYKNMEEIRDILHISDVFINSSFAKEGGPRNILEASACNVRCISTKVGIAKDVFSETNLYEAHDIKTLREKIINYRNLPIVDVSRYDWGNICKNFMEEINYLGKSHSLSSPT